MNEPLHVVPKPARKPKVVRRQGLGATTWEQRRKLTARQLIGLMGPLHVRHPQYKAKPKAVSVHVENLAGRQPVFQCFDASLLGQIRALFRMVTR